MSKEKTGNETTLKKMWNMHRRIDVGHIESMDKGIPKDRFAQNKAFKEIIQYLIHRSMI